MTSNDILNSIQYLRNKVVYKKPEITVNNLNFTFNNKAFTLNCQSILNTAKGLTLPIPLGGWQEDIHKYSPLEVDVNSEEWNPEYLRRNKRGYIIASIPMFNITFWSILYVTNQVPTFLEYAKIYLNSYCEVVQNDQILENKKYFKDGQNHEIQSDKIITFEDGVQHPNYTLRFKPFAKADLVINQFTVEQLLKRLYNVYASLIRDLVHIVIFQAFGANVYYNSTLDNKGGIDLVVNGIKIRALTSTNRADKAAYLKETERHNGINDSIILKAYVTNKDNKIVIPTDSIVQTILKDIANGTIQGEYVY